jgi:Uma2 family endonuclease
MVLDVVTKIGMPMVAFLEQMAKEPFELLESERIVKLATIAEHSNIIRMLFVLLYQFITSNKLGEIFQDSTYALTDAPDWVKGSRIPDLMFYAAPRFHHYTQTMPDWKKKPYLLIPDLTIEIVSPNDTYSIINKKVTADLKNGVRWVWVLDPQEKNAVIYTGNQIVMLKETDVLKNEELLPGLKIALKDLFE